MKISHIEHLGIAVKSIEEALPYYENVLGLKCYNIETVEDQKVRTAFLKVGDVKIELLEPTSPESTIAKFIEKNNGNGGMHHLAFAVEDGVANGLAEIEEKGIRLIDPAAPSPAAQDAQSQLVNWPVQIKLAPVRAPYFEDAALLIAADCTAYAYAAFHSRFLAGRVCLIGCPKLDDVDYSEKLTEILRGNSIRSVTIVRMEVPLLRRAGDGRKARPPAEWEVPPVARRDRPHRRQHHRRLKQIAPEGHSPSGVREFRCAPRLAPP